MTCWIGRAQSGRRAKVRALTAAALAAVLALPAPARATPPRNPKTAALLSLLVPGLGELYAGGPRSGRFFLFTEGSLWTGLLLFEHLESSRRDNFTAYAAAHAGLEPAGKSDTYFDEVGIYQSLAARNRYEQYVAGEDANLRPETPENDWAWDSEASRLTYRTLRKKAVSAREKGVLFIGGLLFNRFVSSINAAHIARKTRPRPDVGLRVVPSSAGGAFAVLDARF